MAKLLEARGVQPSTTHNNRLTQILLLLSINMHFAAPAITSAKLCTRSINLDFFLMRIVMSYFNRRLWEPVTVTAPDSQCQSQRREAACIHRRDFRGYLSTKLV